MRARSMPRPRLRPVVVAFACLLGLFAPATASAVVSDVQSLDGPSADVVDLGDAAMSEDGSGGVVWLKRVDGRSHVFAAQFRDGVWGPARRVDAGQSFDSSWPRIGAGDGGRLVVTWVQEFGVESDRLFSATLDPGAGGFQPPVPIDFNVGEATSTFPDLAMARGGQAYLAYRVVTDVSPSNPPGYVGADLRVARYNGRLWSVLGTPVDRNVAAPVRMPSEDNAPEIGIDVQGQGVVAWQEPDDEFVDRVWARRLFGTSTGIPLQVSPSSWEGAPLRGPADAFSLDIAGFGQAAIAFRQQPGQASKLAAPRVLVNEMPDVFAEKAGAFAGEHLADGEPRGGLGAPSVAVDPRGLYAAAFGAGAATLLGSGDDVSAGKVERIDEGGSSIPGDPLVDVAETALSVAAGGAIGRLALGGSGLGDAIVAWKQGEGAGAHIAAAVVDAPPDPFLVLLPGGWQSKPRIPVAWDHAPNAIGGVRYSVSVDDEPVVENRKGLQARLSPDDVGDGRHRVQIFALDASGQETGSRSGPLLVDRTGPEVELRRRVRRVTVIVGDGPAKESSGLRGRSVRVSFGERGGASASASASGKRRAGKARRRKATVARVSHTYGSRGSFRIVVRARDRAGNVTVAKRTVRVG
jgi:hypothetical protein